MADDWIIVDGDGGIIDRARFLEVVESGELAHSELSNENARVRVYGPTAVVTAVARSKGTYRGQPFATHERATSVHVKRDGRWLCVLTHLTPISQGKTPASS